MKFNIAYLITSLKLFCIVFQACFALVAPIILRKIVSSIACWRENKTLESFYLFSFNSFFWAVVRVECLLE